MARPPFDFLESVCEKLIGRDAAVLPPDNFSEVTITGLLDRYGELAPATAIGRAIAELEEHFARRSSRLPFSYHEGTGEYRNDRDRDYVRFISEAASIRGDGEMARDFESSVATRLGTRVTGEVHRVGWPRMQCRLKVEFLAYLETLGFSDQVAYGKDKDCGFDVLWLPPLGPVPVRPVISLQCKNSHFRVDISVSRTKRSLRLHAVRTAESTYMICIIFNDYIDDRDKRLHRGCDFVPLGLSDLGSLAAGSAIRIL